MATRKVSQPAYDTDKLKGGLLAQYEVLFKDIRHLPLNILEIGVLKGGSLLWAKDYFPNAQIYGVDINLPDLKEDRITLIKADQSKPETLHPICRPYDIVIDDGCHFAPETEQTFNVFWPHAKMYIIEDWDAAFKRPVYKGMESLIAKILRNKKRLGITDLLIFNQLKSFAYFKK